MSTNWSQQRRDDYADGYEFARQEISEQGEEIDWCEEHDASRHFQSKSCHEFVDLYRARATSSSPLLKPCRMVPSLRIPSAVLDLAKNEEE